LENGTEQALTQVVMEICPDGERVSPVIHFRSSRPEGHRILLEQRIIFLLSHSTFKDKEDLWD
jgi:hypothetical protein